MKDSQASVWIVGVCLHDGGVCKNKGESMEKFYRAWLARGKELNSSRSFETNRGAIESGRSNKEVAEEVGHVRTTAGRREEGIREDERSLGVEGPHVLISREKVSEDVKLGVDLRRGKGEKEECRLGIVTINKGIAFSHVDGGFSNNALSEMELDLGPGVDRKYLGQERKEASWNDEAHSEVTRRGGIKEKQKAKSLEIKHKVKRIGARGRDLKKKARSKVWSQGISDSLGERGVEEVAKEVAHDFSFPTAVAAEAQHRREQ